jgi:hypothetical protein
LRYLFGIEGDLTKEDEAYLFNLEEGIFSKNNYRDYLDRTFSSDFREWWEGSTNFERSYDKLQGLKLSTGMLFLLSLDGGGPLDTWSTNFDWDEEYVFLTNNESLRLFGFIGEKTGFLSHFDPYFDYVIPPLESSWEFLDDVAAVSDLEAEDLKETLNEVKRSFNSLTPHIFNSKLTNITDWYQSLPDTFFHPTFLASYYSVFQPSKSRRRREHFFYSLSFFLITWLWN